MFIPVPADPDCRNVVVSVTIYSSHLWMLNHVDERAHDWTLCKFVPVYKTGDRTLCVNDHDSTIPIKRENRKEVYLYNAILLNISKRSDMDQTVLPANFTMSACSSSNRTRPRNINRNKTWEQFARTLADIGKFFWAHKFVCVQIWETRAPSAPGRFRLPYIHSIIVRLIIL